MDVMLPLIGSGILIMKIKTKERKVIPDPIDDRNKLWSLTPIPSREIIIINKVRNPTIEKKKELDNKYISLLYYWNCTKEYISYRI